LGAELGDHAIRSCATSEADEEEATDLNGRILNLLELGRREEAIRLYYEVLGGDIKVAEAAIDELAKSVEFAEVRSGVPLPVARARSGWLSGWVAAIKALMGVGRA
jgi:hypothetical protein